MQPASEGPGELGELPLAPASLFLTSPVGCFFPDVRMRNSTLGANEKPAAPFGSFSPEGQYFSLEILSGTNL